VKRILLILASVAFLLSIFQTDTLAQRKKHKKKKAKKAVACARTLATCPVEGCGSKSDPLLNRSKNRIDAPSEGDIRDMSLADIKGLSQALPAGWKEGDARDTFTGTGLEGQAVRTMGYLWSSKREHAESCNCGLDAAGITGQLLTDIHMVVTTTKNANEKSSITAEITPRVRALRPNPNTWHWSSIHTFNKKFIRITGWLMLDTHHLVSAPLKRATNWEVHPITRLEVCVSTVTKCRSGAGWKEVK